jgi:hypothetical protein
MSRQPSVCLVFVDGVGIGRNAAEVNPLVGAMPVLRRLLGGSLPLRGDPHRHSPAGRCVPVNATLGVAGLPQSGTGQTALLAGVNAAKLIGKHFGPYPYSTLRPVLDERNLFVRLQGRGKSVAYVNAFPPRYFEYMAARPSRRSAIASAWLATGRALGTTAEIIAGEGLSADITGERWNRGGFPPVPELTPGEAGRRLARIAQAHAFSLFEFFDTDHAGHSGSMEEARMVLARLDEFLGGMLDTMDHATTLLLITSDHGNIEDLSTKSHTRNPVPLVAAGWKRAEAVRAVRSLDQVAGAVLSLLV